MMRVRAQMMGLVGLALASAFAAKEARDKAQDVAVSLRERPLVRGQGYRPVSRGHSSRKIGPKRRRRLWRAAARRKAA